MQAKTTWLLLFFVASAIICALVLNVALIDVFNWLQFENSRVLGDSLKLSGLIGIGVSIVLALFFGVFYGKSRTYIEQVIVEFNKVAFPEWLETRNATFVVVLVSVVASVILGLFDITFGWLSKNNFFIW